MVLGGGISRVLPAFSTTGVHGKKATRACWFVGDHPVNDIAGAHSAGMRAIWLRGFHDWPGDLEPRTTIAALADLEALLGA